MTTCAPPDRAFKGIAQSLVEVTLKQPATWGFVIYRCSYNNEDAWQTILQKMNDETAATLESEGEDELVRRHEMIIMEDKAKYDGATSHDIRDHFTSWVFNTVPYITIKVPTESELQLTLYNYCLFVDDLCLESVEHMETPVVKLLGKHFGARDPEDRDYTIHPDYEDGETDMEEEDVGWMYLKVDGYAEMYNALEEDEWWYELYRRPPLLSYFTLAPQNPGFWRKNRPSLSN
ncbi:hypothetical protein TEQG_00210 [Trichophyton equinum CBS 127.97]|uniref:Uncharacterized protein n=1 Tax=Trichophyton equinum (strain ATCC MYA-4606 / CBS 127.97) TaxID=559882 RepID=F2PGZ0_TRIEC|nr:hypothetical protein TEQG_00210 [Trichophyton equinum CBS 127.97]